MKPLNIIFAGTPDFALPCLDALGTSGHNLAAVYTQPDRPAGRGQKLQASPVKEWALRHDLPVYQPVNFKDAASIAQLSDLAPDVIVVIAYGLILPEAVLNIPPLGCINVHASLLPAWRGASPIQHALLHGDTQSGVTIMQMEKGMDTGAAFAVAKCPVDPDETARSLHDKLAQAAINPLLSTLEKTAKGEARLTPQNDDLATYAPKIKKQDALINWQQPAAAIDRMIRAFNPWPVAWTHADGNILRIHRARVIHSDCQHPPGTIISIDKKGILAATGLELLLIERLQFPGGKAMAVADWLNSGRRDLPPGMVLK